MREYGLSFDKKEHASIREEASVRAAKMQRAFLQGAAAVSERSRATLTLQALKEFVYYHSSHLAYDLFVDKAATLDRLESANSRSIEASKTHIVESGV